MPHRSIAHYALDFVDSLPTVPRINYTNAVLAKRRWGQNLYCRNNYHLPHHGTTARVDYLPVQRHAIYVAKWFIPFYIHSKAHTKAAKKWLDTFETRSKKTGKNHNTVVSDHYFEHSQLGKEDEPQVPILVCMTYADRLLSEEMDDDGKYHTGNAKKTIAENLGVCILTWHFS